MQNFGRNWSITEIVNESGGRNITPNGWQVIMILALDMRVV